jgi:acetyl-CoA carboxylase biotin carboxyl carrier protein
VATFVATLHRSEDTVVLGAPSVGEWVPLHANLVIEPGDQIGVLYILNRPHPVFAPSGGRGQFEAQAKSMVAYGDSIGLFAPKEQEFESDTRPDAQGLPASVFESPTSGRFYARPTPESEAFVKVGDEISNGQVVCLLEVMKTFNRIEYSGSSKVRVVRILPNDGDDLESGDAIFELEEIY